MKQITTLEKYPYQIGVGTCEISERAKRYVTQALNNNRLSYGPFSVSFEKAFAKAHGSRFAVWVNSGTSSLHISIAALKEKYRWDDDDEIIIPAVTFVSDINVIRSNSLRPVIVDIDPKTYTIDPSKIVEKITPRTRAIMPTHLCGLSAEMDALVDIARTHHLRIIEDACEASFAKYKNRPVGSFGDIGCFSTYQAHILATGVGGFALTNDEELAVMLRSLANHGRDGIYLSIDDDQGKSDQELKEIVARRFNFIRLGFSYRTTELEAAIGLAQMEDGIEREIIKRQENARLLLKLLAPFSVVLQLPEWPEHCDHVFMMFPIVVRKNSGITRDELVSFLEVHNIETRMLLPLINQPYVVNLLGDLAAVNPVAHWANTHGFYIGCHPSMGVKEISFIAKAVGHFLGRS